MAFWGVWKQKITGRLISSSYLSPFLSFPIILTPISIHVYINHTPSTITATPTYHFSFTVRLTFLPKFEPLTLIYRPITNPELSPLSHRELVTNPTNKCWYEQFVLRPTLPPGNIRIHLRNHKREMQKIAWDVLYFIVIFGLKNTIIGLFRYTQIQLEREICKYFLHSFQRVSIVFVLSASLSSWIFDKERPRLYKRWPSSTYIQTELTEYSVMCSARFSIPYEPCERRWEARWPHG